ncbi:Acg family FMN-binding oxidoreductase [Jidongwangia harbinensis]|uniref:Acg family FMN-binding oxidoreductase n=1 Tax=Jidongwangia harbinensis TaxID=2878561 RepID=UPI001CD97D18|nr:nitroreductase [Jidongwangia harbinensis]MCA2213946.1 nitroreductase [Jidongwangia harbinensis]
MTASPDRPARSEVRAVLDAAARASLHAPSVFNTQPWRWRLAADRLELYAETSRQLDTVDPDGRLMLLSCGAALHHARTVIASIGWTAVVERLPEDARPDLLARIRLGTAVPANPEARRMAAAIHRRRTDRRAFGERPVPADVLTRLRRFVEHEGAYLHVVRRDQMPMLAISTARAADAELDDPAYRAELHQWTNRPAFHGDGVPPATAVKPAPRRVPVRDYTPDGSAGLVAGDGHDQGAAYVVLFGTTTERADLLRGGEALSALLLLATADGLATAPLSDTIEVDWPRHLLRGLLSDVGEPYLVVRLGYAEDGAPLPAAPRRAAEDVITVEGDLR